MVFDVLGTAVSVFWYNQGLRIKRKQRVHRGLHGEIETVLSSCYTWGTEDKTL